MSEYANTREKRLAALAVAVVVLVTVLLIVETFRLLLPGLDRKSTRLNSSHVT